MEFNIIINDIQTNINTNGNNNIIIIFEYIKKSNILINNFFQIDIKSSIDNLGILEEKLGDLKEISVIFFIIMLIINKLPLFILFLFFFILLNNY